MKTEFFTVRLTPAEKAKLFSYAEKYHLSMATVLRLMISSDDIKQDIKNVKDKN